MQDVDHGTMLNTRAWDALARGDYRLAECLYRESAFYCLPKSDPTSGFAIQIEKATQARALAQQQQGR